MTQNADYALPCGHTAPTFEMNDKGRPIGAWPIVNPGYSLLNGPTHPPIAWCSQDGWVDISQEMFDQIRAAQNDSSGEKDE